MKQFAHHVSRLSFLEKNDYFCPTVSVKDKLNRSQQSLQQSLAHAVPAYYLNQPSNVPSPLSFPLHFPLLTSFMISKSLPLSTYCVHGNTEKTQHEILYGRRLQINFNQIFSHFRDSASMLDVLHPLIFGKCVVAKTAFSVKVGLYNGSTEIQSSLVWIISSKQSVIIEASVTLPFFSNLTTITTKKTKKSGLFVELQCRV